MKGFARYAAVIFNIDRFVVRRENGQEREALLGQLETDGMKKPMPVFDLGAGERYYMMTALRPAPAE